MIPSAEPCVYLCCFCGGVTPAVAEERVWYLTLQREPGRGLQDFFAHRECLRAHMHASIPLLSEIDAPASEHE